MERAHSSYRRLEMVSLAIVLFLAFSSIVASGGASASDQRTCGVLYVGAFGGIATPKSSTFKTIQAAVDAAKPSDWILIAPGDYHERGDMGAYVPSASDVSDGWSTAVSISPHRESIYAGMNRNSVIVDGTLSKASTPCSSAACESEHAGWEKGATGS